jgi:dipeptidyl aminopeptidase/acylaminoacyl peptidase
MLAAPEADYARAESFLPWKVQPLVYGATVRPNWLEGDRFWYRNSIPEGHEFVVVDAARRNRARLFDHERLAAALSAAADTSYSAYALPFTTFTPIADGNRLFLIAGNSTYICDLRAYRCEPGTFEPFRGEAARPVGVGQAAAGLLVRARPADRNTVASPDGKLAAFIRDYNLWVRDLETGRESQLTTDGVKDFGYATDNQAWARSETPTLLWSPDSRKIATYRQDERGVGEMYLVESRVGHPTLQAWKYPLPGDSVVPMLERVIIHLDGAGPNGAGGAGDASGPGSRGAAGATPRVVRLQTPPDHHRSTVCDGIKCGEFSDVEWSADSRHFAFVSTSRDYKHVALKVADPTTGAVRTILEESTPTYFESTLTGRGQNWRVLHGSNEVIWFSQRDDWGHLYLYDLASGRLKNRITSGDWNVVDLLRVDEKSRTIWFTGVGREQGRDPYFRHLYRVRLDGKQLALLTPEDADHDVALAPSGRYFVDSYSRPDVAPVTTVRQADGKGAFTVERADITRLQASGWVPPIPFTVKARDGVTDLYGLLFRPSNFDPARKYPIINNIYPGPQTGSVRGRSFAAARGDAQALAELGFVVVQIDAMGTPLRSKTFHAAYYGDMGDNGLPDQIAGMKQLAERHPWIDLGRVGIYGHSGGGFASTAALLRYPDFFHVAVSSAGNHDNRLYSYHWGEKWHGLLERGADGTDSYDSQANQLLVENLKGKLLLAHGSADDNVSPDNTLVLVDALIKANKDFDLVIFPNRRHGFSQEEYMLRRRWDYFVRHLLGAEPPQEYEFRRGPRVP